MPELKQLTRAKPTSCEIDLGEGDIVKVTFDRNKITPAWMQSAEKRDNERDVLSLPKALSEVILLWDVTSDGEPFGHTPENIAQLSYPAQQGLLQRIIEAAVPASEEGNVSSNTSSTPSQSSSSEPASLQNGQAPSPSPTPSASPSPT